MRRIDVRVLRRAPGAPGRFTRHELEVAPDETILSLLDRLREASDGGLAFRGACRHGMCGECALSVNGEGVLACVTRADEAAGRRGRLRIEPLRGFPVVRDLVIDRASFFARHRDAKPWLEPKADVPAREHLVSPAAVVALRRSEECVLCGICESACPVVTTGGAFAGPAALLKSFARIVDERDAATEARLAWCGSNDGAYRCHGAFACLDACPKGLDPADAIFELRRLTERGRP